MLKPYYFYTTLLLGTIMSGNALADCTSPTFQRRALRNTLIRNTVCYPGSQEEHRGRSQLWDNKTGDRRHNIDPKIQIGSWVIIDNAPNPAQIEYNYFKGADSAGPFIFTPHNDGPGLISFCAGNTLVQSATIVNGTSGC